MTKNLKRFFSMLLALSMVFSLVLPAAATETEEHDHAAHVEEATQEVSQSEPIKLEAALENITVNTEKLEFQTGFENYLVLVDPDTEIDMEDPAILAFESELKEIKVLNAEGEAVPLTEEQKAEILGMYQQYLNHWDANMDVLGLQTPFFLSFNDNGEDGYGILGEMLALSNLPVDAVRAGMISYDDLSGMILNFMLGDQLGVALYGAKIEAARDEALAQVAASGAQTEAQKLLVLNDWLAHKNTFDMPYIMNSGKDVPPMVAENPVKHEYYDVVYGKVKEIYSESIAKTFEDNIRNGLEAEFKRQYYTGAVQNIFYQGGIAQAYENADLIAAVKQGIYDQALLQGKQSAYDQAFDGYIAATQHIHNAVVTFTWADDNTAQATVACEGCTDTLKCGTVAVTAATTAATCETAGVTTYTATVKVTDSADAEVAYTSTTNTKEVTVAALEHDYDETTGVCKREGCDAVKPADAALVSETEEQEVLNEENKTEEVLTEETETEEELTEETASSASATPEEITFEAEDENVTVAAEGDPEYMQGVTTREAENAEAHAAAVQVVGENLSALEAAAQDASNDEATLQAALKQAIEGDPNDNNDTAVEQQINAEANAFIEANAEALATDPAGFIDSQEMFLQDAPVTDAEGNYIIGEDGNPVMMPLNQQLHQGWEVFWEDAKTNGVEVDPVNAPGYKMTVDQIVEQQMDVPQEDPMLTKLDANGNPILDENGNVTYMTPNEAVGVFAAQAAEGLAGGIINYWEGSHFGALGFTTPTSVCLGYARAYAYLVQCMHPEIYGVSADADMSDPANWKLRKDVYKYNEDGSINIDEGYVVDNVRVTFAAQVTMYGQKEDNFNADHFWNAVKVDGKWYYVDPCYTDVFTEVMMRDRVETDGQMNHLYFLFSHDSCVDLYEGNYKEIKGLYENAANHTDYEDAWVSRIASNTYFDGGYAYYLYDSTDMLTMMTDFENQNQMSEEEEATYKIVRHKLTGNDLGNGDTDYEELIVFNYVASEGADPVAQVRDPATGTMVNNDLLTELYEKHEAYVEDYPSIMLTAALYNGKIYFNIANYILSYDLETGAIAMVKEYNTVQGKRDTTNPFGGMAFDVVASGGDFTVENHPIAGMTIKNGTMVVSVATNFAFISGKSDRCDPASSGYGYAYEESNYNADYNTYLDLSGYDDAQLEQFGYVKETNDNDEFMWTANFVEELSMAHLTGEHTYEAVSVEATCGIDAYTENRCTTCGAIEADSRVYEEGTAADHHYIEFHETYYTKDANGEWNTGVSYVCTVCNHAVVEPTEPSGMMGDQQENQEEYQENLAIFEAAKASAGHTYAPANAVWAEDYSTVTFSILECTSVCPERKGKLDCLLNDDTIRLELAEEQTVEATAEVTGNCEDGVTTIHKAEGEVKVSDDLTVKFSLTSEVLTTPAGEHDWDEGVVVKESTMEEEGLREYTCEVCGETKEEVLLARNHGEHENTAVVTAPNCIDDGYTTYTCKLCGESYISDRVEKLGHTEVQVEAVAETCTTDGKTAGVYCSVCEEVLSGLTVVPATGHTEVVDSYVAPTCTATGLTEGKHCSVCNEVLVAQDLIQAAGHIEAVDPALDPTCTTAGKTEGKYCSVCEITLVPSEQIAALGHTLDEGVITQEPTAKEPGVRTRTCSVCGETEDEEVAYEATDVQRISGKDRVKTALSVADALKDTLGVEQFDAVILAIGDNEKFADALAGSYLANVKGAPILLYTNSGLSQMNVDFIKENLKADGTVYILGGTGAIPATDEETLADYTVKRLSGKTRYETNLAILNEAGVASANEILIATGTNFADSLSASAVGLPLMLVDGKAAKLNDAQLEFLQGVKGKKVTIIGGTGAVSEELEAAIEEIMGVEAERISGKARHNTSVLIAQKYFRNPDNALITYAWNFPDGLAGGPLAYAMGAPLLLTNAGQEAIANEYIAAEGIENGYVLGGDSAVSDSTAQKVFGLSEDAVIAKAYYTK